MGPDPITGVIVTGRRPPVQSQPGAAESISRIDQPDRAAGSGRLKGPASAASPA